MQPLSASQMLAVWERGLEQIPLERALTLLQAASPECDRQTLAALSIGQRDARLLTLREWAFGSEISACAFCPQCRQSLEFTFQVDDLLQRGKSEIAEVPYSFAGYEMLLRPVNSVDLVACSGLDMTAIHRRLLGCCLLSGRSGNVTISHDQVPDEVAWRTSRVQTLRRIFTSRLRVRIALIVFARPLTSSHFSGARLTPRSAAFCGRYTRWPRRMGGRRTTSSR